MIYLTTGANGAGKTLITLRDVRAAQIAENRPVYYHGFDMEPAIEAQFGWKKFDPKQWQALPDGSICVMDECQNEFPVRGPSAPVPEYIRMIAQDRRKRGFDFYMITPHPRLIDIFVRSLIESPSWHRHLKRAFGADVVSELRFNSVDMQCATPSSASRAEVKITSYPKEVFSWYRSASMHTGKRRYPKALFVLAAAVLAVPLLFWFVYSSLAARMSPTAVAKPALSASAPSAVAAGGAIAPAFKARLASENSMDDYIAAHRERIPGFPFSAPRYDAITAPVEAPYPAACVASKTRCECFTQQATRLATSPEICRQIASDGFFIAWNKPSSAVVPRAVAAAAQPVQPGEKLLIHSSPSALQAPAPDAEAQHDGANVGAMRLRALRAKQSS